jgi:hypothetical protein
MSIDSELSEFYKKHGFGEQVGARSFTVPVYTGCMLVPLPNIETRHVYLKYHDLHHLVTGYSVGRIGEGEVSAWELGTGSLFVNPVLGVMNFIALSTGLVLQPKRMWTAFVRGCHSNNLYRQRDRAKIDAAAWPDVVAVRHAILMVKHPMIPLVFRALEFALYAAVAMGIHAVIAIPAVVARFITDMSLGYSIFKAVKPVKRDDLY